MFLYGNRQFQLSFNLTSFPGQFKRWHNFAKDVSGFTFILDTGAIYVLVWDSLLKVWY